MYVLRALVSLLAFSLLPGCAGEGSYRLHLIFEDEEARESVAEVAIWVMDPGGHACSALIVGDVDPEVGMTVHSRLLVTMPHDNLPKLTRVPTGTLLFFAEGRTASGARILRGCTEGEVKAREDTEVTVALAWFCRPDPLGEIPFNDEDDDCDGLTDECAIDAECDDQNGCTMDLCVQDECHRITSDNGTLCSDGNACTADDSCADGVCRGSAKDCTFLTLGCLQGVCDPVTGACGQAPAANGTGCDDGLFCTLNDFCQEGVCDGDENHCDDGDDCTQDNCNEGDSICDHPLQPLPGLEGLQVPGTCDNTQDDDCDGLVDAADPNCNACTSDSECDDNNACTRDECADAQCVNTAYQDGTPCDDGLFCTVDDVCNSAACGGRARDCAQPDILCVHGICRESTQECDVEDKPDGAPCDDGGYCTQGDSCAGGTCQPGPDLDCGDGDDCTVDACNEAADRCDNVLQPIPGAEGPPGDATCFNGVDDDCDGDTDLIDGSCFECTDSTSCEDSNPCTDDACTDGVCVNSAVADSAPCDDGLYCSQSDACQLGACTGTGQVDCSHLDDECNTGVCSESDDQCEQLPVGDGYPCEDGDTCTMDDNCRQGSCAGDPLDFDGDGYVSDVCAGVDCNDSLSAINPGALEGPAGDPSCADGLDNNCDSLTDANAPGCIPSAGACSLDGWCWMHPQPSGLALHDVWGSQVDDFWAVGEDGMVLHFDGSNWEFHPSPTPATLRAVHGVDKDDVWAVGDDGAAIHWSGTQWALRPPGESYQLKDVWTYPGGAWAVGEDVILHFDGSDWGLRPDGPQCNLETVFGLAADDVWVGGLYSACGGGVQRWYGNEWSPLPTNSGGMITSLWGRSNQDMWTTSVAEIYHWTGSDWTEEYNGTTSLNVIWGSDASNVWAAGEAMLRWDGAEFAFENPGATWIAFGFPEYHGIWGTSADNIWAVGQQGMIAHRTASSWTSVSHKTTGRQYSITGTSADDVWTAGDNGEILHFDGVSWSYLLTYDSDHLLAAWAASASTVWFAGKRGTIFLWQQPGGFEDLSHGTTSDHWYGVWASDAGDVWVVGEAGALSGNGASWNERNDGLSSGLHAVWGSSPAEVWAGGQDTIYQWTGSTWAPSHTVPGTWITGLSGSGSNDVWAVFADGSVVRYNGITWSHVAALPFPPEGIWCVALNDCYAAGMQGSIYHLTGAGFEPMESGTSNSLEAIWADPSGGSVWVTGDRATILRLQP